MGGVEGSGGGLVHLEQMIGRTTLSAYDLNTLSELAADMADAEKLLSKATRPKVNTMLTEYLTQLRKEFNTRSANRGTPMPKQQKATETGAARGMIATPSPHSSEFCVGGRIHKTTGACCDSRCGPCATWGCGKRARLAKLRQLSCCPLLILKHGQLCKRPSQTACTIAGLGTQRKVSPHSLTETGAARGIIASPSPHSLASAGAAITGPSVPLTRFEFGPGPLGLGLSNAAGGGVFISEVPAGGAGERQGVRVGCLVLELAGIDVRHATHHELFTRIGTLPRPLVLVTALEATSTFAPPLDFAPPLVLPGSSLSTSRLVLHNTPPDTPPAAYCVGGRVHKITGACCDSRCGPCATRGCEERAQLTKLRQLSCCPLLILEHGQLCKRPSQTACTIAGLGTQRKVSPHLRCRTGIAGRLNASRRHVHAHDSACCALPCGKCIDDQGCSSRPGGRSQCCPSYFLETDQRCDGPNEIGCTYTQWSSWMRSAHVVWGVYARTCSEVDPFTAACIGCSAPHTYGVALLDGPSSANARNYASWRCQGVDRTFFRDHVLPHHPFGSKIPPSEARYWPRTRALFLQMTLNVPNADYYLKLDCDTFLNMDILRTRLLVHLEPGLHKPPDYVGKSMGGTFSFKGRNLMYMQGGAYALSRRAALAVANCTLGSWKWCPPTVFRNRRDPVADAKMHQSCNYPAANAEDVYVGTCLQEAFFSIEDQLHYDDHPCMLTLKAGRSHSLTRIGTQTAGLHETTRHGLKLLIRLLEKHNRSCGPCIISAHPLKSVGILLSAREHSLRAGCRTEPLQLGVALRNMS